MERLLKSNEVAVLLAVHPMAIYKWRKQGLLPFYKICKCVRFKLEDIERFIKQMRVRGR
jgi:excisionase family DNA binding protein